MRAACQTLAISLNIMRIQWADLCRFFVLKCKSFTVSLFAAIRS
jgi:hypothetical protein